MSEHDDQKGQEQPKPTTRTPPTRHTYQSVIDQIINKAHADGLMDNLPGQGQPLNLDDDALVPDEYRLGHRMLKASGFAPPWIESRRDIDQERADVASWLADANRRWPRLTAPARTALQTGYRRKLDDLQRMIMNYNLKAPLGAPQIEGLRIAEELAKLGG